MFTIRANSPAVRAGRPFIKEFFPQTVSIEIRKEISILDRHGGKRVVQRFNPCARKLWAIFIPLRTDDVRARIRISCLSKSRIKTAF